MSERADTLARIDRAKELVSNAVKLLSAAHEFIPHALAVEVAGSRGPDGVEAEEAIRLMQWSSSCWSEVLLLDMTLRGKLTAHWPEGAKEPSFMKPKAHP